MSAFIRIVWSILSYIPLMFTIGLALIADACCDKKLISEWPIGLYIVIASIIGIILMMIILRLAKNKLSTTTMDFVSGESKDNDMLSHIITVLIPFITLSLTSINWIMFGFIIALIVVLMVITKTVSTNIVMYLLGYKYYKVQAKSGVTYTLITKKKRLNLKSEYLVVEIFNEVYLEV